MQTPAPSAVVNRLSVAWRLPRGAATGPRAILAALLLLTLALRLLSARQADPIRSDSVQYIQTAERLEAGSFAVAFAGLGPNLYSAILLLLHKLGLDYVTAGKLWGVAVSTLTLLPLVGLVRRQFGRTVGWVSGFLYAVHPRFIEWSGEIVRDPTFWLLFVSTLYWMRRAHDSRNWAWFVAGGCGLVAAIHVRTEGWLLLLPPLAWALSRCWRMEWRPAACLAAVLASPLAALLLLNATLFRDQPQWARLDQLARTVYAKCSESQATRASVAAAAGTRARPASHQAVYFVKKLVKGLDAWLVLPTLLGMFRLRRRMRSPELASLLAISLTIVALVAAYVALFGEINTRYFLTGVLLWLPYAAYGWIVIVNYARRKLAAAASWMPGKPALSGGLAAVLAVAGGIDGLGVNRGPLHRDAALGQWLRANGGEDAVVATWRYEPLIQYYAHGRSNVVAAVNPGWEPALRVHEPRIVVIDPAAIDGAEFLQLIAGRSDFRYRLIHGEAPSAGRAGRQVYRQLDGGMRQRDEALGEWLRANGGEGAVIATWRHEPRLVERAGGRANVLALVNPGWEPTLRAEQPQFVVIDPTAGDGAEFHDLIGGRSEYRYQLVHTEAPAEFRSSRQVYRLLDGGTRPRDEALGDWLRANGSPGTVIATWRHEPRMVERAGGRVNILAGINPGWEPTLRVDQPQLVVIDPAAADGVEFLKLVGDNAKFRYQLLHTEGPSEFHASRQVYGQADFIARRQAGRPEQLASPADAAATRK